MFFTFVLLVYLILLRNKERSTYFLIGFYFNIFLLFTAGFIGISLPMSRGIKFILLQYVFGASALVFLLLFAYHFQEIYRKKEMQKVTAISSAVAILISIYIVEGIISGKEFSGYQIAWIAIVAAIEFLWVLLVLLRKSVEFSHFREKSLKNYVKVFFKPSTTQARRNIIFAYLMILPIIMSFFVYAAYIEAISKDFHNFVFTEGSALFFFLFVLLYLNYSNIPTSLVAKIAGISLVSVIILLNTIGFFLLKENQSYFENINKLKAEVCKEKILAGHLKNFPEDVVYILKSPEKKGPFSNDFKLIYSSEEWKDLEFIRADNIKKAGQKLNWSEGILRIDRNYEDALHKEPKYFAYYFKIEDSVFEVGISSLPYRLNLHKMVIKFMVIVLILFFLIIFIYPFFFTFNLLVPVKNLIKGAKQIEEGNLELKLPVRVMDEFGILSTAFNKMASSLKKYRQELIEYSKTLEKKVAERTKDLEEKNRMLLQMKKELEIAALTDPLTGLLNRRALYEFMNHEVKRVKRNNKPFSIVLCDIDNFKKINDSYGHDCGDYILRETGKLLRKNLREIDRVGRWGGEEFLILLPETQLKDAINVAEKLRLIISSHRFEYTPELTLTITITFGVSCFRPGSSLNNCLKNADQALYLGKSSGKNKVVTVDT